MSKALLYLAITLIPNFCPGQTETFNYKEYTTGLASTFGIKVQSINRTTGEVIISGAIDDNRRPFNLPITFIWGDNTPNTVGYFPQTHRYSSIAQNQLIRAVGDFKGGLKDTAEVFVNFTKPQISLKPVDPKLKVTIPNQVVLLPIRNSSQFFSRSYFDDSYFKGPFTRAEIEYILSVGNAIEFDLVHGNVYQFNGKFEQYMLRDSSFGGGNAIIYTNPVCFAMNDRYLNEMYEPIGFSSLMHEVGHNLTLLMPANFLIGEKVSGPGGAIYSETMAQIFQHAVGYELVNNPEKYGLDAVATAILRTEFLSSFRQLRFFYQQYVDKGMNFVTWVDAQNSYEIITYTFGATAYKFCEYVEIQGLGYRIPTQRLTEFLQRFDGEWQKRYDQTKNTPAADSFRATMMVAAISHAFQKDLRADFRALNFPVSDVDWAFLNPQILDVSSKELSVKDAANSTATFDITSNVAWTLTSSQPWLTANANSGTGNKTVTLTATANTALSPRTATVTIAANGLAARTVTVTQARVAPSLTVSTTTLNLDFAEGSTATFDIASNTAWTVVSSQPWLTLAPASGSENAKVTIAGSVNPLIDPRKGLVTVRANGVTDKTIEVSQAAAPITGLSAAVGREVKVFPNPAHEWLKVDGLPANSHITLYDLGGNVMKEVKSRKPETSINIQDLPTGLYLILVRQEGYYTFFKVFKAK